MAGLESILRKRLPPPFLLQDDEDVSHGLAQEFVELPEQEEELIFQALRLNDVNKVSMLLRHGTDVNLQHEGGPCVVKCPWLYRSIQMKKYCPLHIAALHSTMEMLDVLLRHGGDVNQVDGNNRTALFLATAAARLDVVKLLIEKGADTNTQTTSQRTALIEAVSLNRRHLVDVLIDAGADLDLVDIKGSTALNYSVMLPQVDLSIVRRLIDAGASVNKRNQKGATPLHFAVSMKQVDKIQALLDAGAYVNAADDSLKTAFHIAANDGQGIFVAKLLLRHGAHPDTRDKTGRTPLDWAVAQGKLRVLQMLLLADCDRDYSLFSSEMVQKLCEKVPVFANWLHHEMYNPKSLRRLCRATIRKSLSVAGLVKTNELPLPTTLKDFLLVKYFE